MECSRIEHFIHFSYYITDSCIVFQNHNQHWPALSQWMVALLNIRDKILILTSTFGKMTKDAPWSALGKCLDNDGTRSLDIIPIKPAIQSEITYLQSHWINHRVCKEGIPFFLLLIAIGGSWPFPLAICMNCCCPSVCQRSMYCMEIAC